MTKVAFVLLTTLAVSIMVLMRNVMKQFRQYKKELKELRKENEKLWAHIRALENY